VHAGHRSGRAFFLAFKMLMRRMQAGRRFPACGRRPALAADRAGLGPADGADPPNFSAARALAKERARPNRRAPQSRLPDRVGRWVFCWILCGRFTLLTARGRYSYSAGYAAPNRRHGKSGVRDGSTCSARDHSTSQSCGLIWGNAGWQV